MKTLYENFEISLNDCNYHNHVHCERIVEHNGKKFKIFINNNQGCNSCNGYGASTDGGIKVWSDVNGWVQIEDYRSADCTKEYTKTSEFFYGCYNPNNDIVTKNYVVEYFDKMEGYIKNVF